MYMYHTHIFHIYIQTEHWGKGKNMEEYTYYLSANSCSVIVLCAWNVSGRTLLLYDRSGLAIDASLLAIY